MLIAFATAAQPIPDKQRIPRGWKISQPVKASGCDRAKTDLLSAKGDFDGDKKEDTAKLLSKENGKSSGVWVWLAAAKSPILVATFEHEPGKHDIGISPVGPGTYDTACGKGYWVCKANETPKLTLNSGLDVFTCERANQFAYWDSKSKAFKTVWMSD